MLRKGEDTREKMSTLLKYFLVGLNIGVIYYIVSRFFKK